MTEPVMAAQIEMLSSLSVALAATPSKQLPLYKQLYEALRQQILDGLILPGSCLPSSRIISRQLSVSRNTAIAALEQLCAEGYAAARAASGIYVLPTLPINLDMSGINNIKSKNLALSSRGKKLSNDAYKLPVRGALATGLPDLTQFPFDLWQRYVARHARNPQLNWQAYPQQGGHSGLRKTIAEYVRISRGIKCQPTQILITHGTQNSLQLAAILLTDPQDRVWLENPGYPGARSAFIAAELNIVNQPVDAEGIAPPPSAWRKPPRLIYVTPSHQYPLGMVMSAARRRDLLAKTAHHQTWLIEDDYDSEFRYAGTPLAALQALSPQQVIYLGTFSKTLFPALRIGYMILPENIMDDFRHTQARHHREPSYIIQSALNDFIVDGHFSSHIRKMRKEYQARRDALLKLFQNQLADRVKYSGIDTGMHLVVHLPAGVDDVAIEQQARQQGIAVRSLRNFYDSGTPKTPALVLGFGNARIQEILIAGQHLINILRQII